MIVEGHAGADDVEDGRAVVAEGTFHERNDLFRIPGEGAGHIGRSELDRQPAEIDGGEIVDHARFELGAEVGGRRELTLREPVDPVVLDDIDDGEIPAEKVDELPDPDRSRVRRPPDTPTATRLRFARTLPVRDRGHAPVNGVEAVALTQPVGRCLRGASNPRQLRDTVRLDSVFIEKP